MDLAQNNLSTLSDIFKNPTSPLTEQKSLNDHSVGAIPGLGQNIL